MSKIVASIANAIPHLMEIKQEVVPKCVDLSMFVHRFVQFLL